METVPGINTCTVGNDKLDCFRELTPEQRKLVDENLVEILFKKGENICKQGSFASHIMVMKKGLAKIYIEGSGEELILKILPAVNIIGLPFLAEGNSHFHYSAKAYLDSTIQIIDINIIRKIIQENSSFAAKIINLMGENNIITYGRFFCLTKKQTYGRLADILLCLAFRVYKEKSFPLDLTRKELAELANMSLETSTRILTKFKADKLITIKDGMVNILDPDRLTVISNNG